MPAKEVIPAGIQHVGIFGPGQSGKTTLTKHLSESLHRQSGIVSLVFDPNGDDWGRHAKVFLKEDEFWRVVWRSKSCAVIVEEGSSTISRDRELIPVFTRIRHCGHKLFIVGHEGTDLLPVMRRQLHNLFLFRQDEDTVPIWRRLFADRRIEAAATLKQYEFLHCVLFGAKDGTNYVKKRKLTL